ncbi:MAG: AMP-binding protein, partial [Spirochaetes bacterium]|nr:AMP-binding protein [Spirochaetota bacterium]
MIRSGLHEYIDLMKKWEERAYLIDYKGYRKKNVQKGDRVILFGRPSPEWVVAFFAILHRGAAVVPLDHNTSQEFLEAVSNRISPALVICENPPVELKVDTIHFSSIEKSGTTRETEPPDIEPDDTAEIVFTSGTTSDPKGVILTHANILSNLGPIEEGVKKKKKLIKLLTPFRIMCTVPYSHMFG